MLNRGSWRVRMKDRKYERMLKREFWDSVSARYYNLNGYRLRLVKRTDNSLRFPSKVNRKEWVESARAF
jgi:hypothetical protein